MRQFTRAATFAALVLTLALPAVAGKPTIQISPFVSEFISGADGCGFDVLLLPEPGKPNGEKIIEFANAYVESGPLFVTAENLATQKTITLNISGPAQASFTGETLALEGPQTGVLPASLAGPAGLPLVFYATGRTVYQYDAFGNLTSVSFAGKAYDLCQMLQ